MSVIKTIDMQCNNCGMVSHQEILLSTFVMDEGLDTRLYPTFFNAKIHECPYCKCTLFLDNADKILKIFNSLSKTVELKTCEGFTFKSEVASKYYRRYMINCQLEDKEMAIRDLMWASWICDDKKDTENASGLREKVISQIDEVDKDKKNGTLQLVKMDFLRRNGKYWQVITEYSKDKIQFEDETMEKIRKIQFKKAIEKDKKIYTLININKDCDDILAINKDNVSFYKMLKGI